MHTLNSKSHFPILETAKINFRHNSLLSFVVSVILLLFIPVIAGTANLDKYESAIPLEMFVSLIGIVMLTPIFQPEQNTDIDDLVSSKYVCTAKIHLIRTIYSIIILSILICIFAWYMNICNCSITLSLVMGTIYEAIFLGSLGMITSSICSSTIIGYMIPIVFYALNYGMGSKLKNYYLFSMTIGQFKPKIYMLITGILFIAGAIILKEIKKKFQ